MMSHIWGLYMMISHFLSATCGDQLCLCDDHQFWGLFMMITYFLDPVCGNQLLFDGGIRSKATSLGYCMVIISLYYKMISYVLSGIW